MINSQPVLMPPESSTSNGSLTSHADMGTRAMRDKPLPGIVHELVDISQVQTGSNSRDVRRLVHGELPEILKAD
jgi:hypothetical protein